ncbi:Oidioi.mRNA.OKI2018_I69.PAR.g12287.t1.cds [Oikopleura dioica]|uniref:Oidioi.mRNA.OKI2018_I69.PAR.g12287.t1.cds n=1 Tax=Oikopleura dioica TaxID=34765 RepID=A0ABN7S5Q9_OIKDI|nr:Oidioi.mRNA.OKI2018_I69.PAR.g12287.t1.cds [Oikopleura dioica]
MKITEDRFKGVIIELPDEEINEKSFEEELKRTWQSGKQLESAASGFTCLTERTRPLLICYKTDSVNIYPQVQSVLYNPEYHHAKKGKVVLLGWLPTDDTNNVPAYPYTGIGVGGLVINSNNQVLMVKEKYAFSEYFKLPGGHVDKGEDLHIAAIREVKEETGIDAKFKGIVQFRHFHDMPIEGHFCSDIYFIILLEPEDETQTIKIQANEIQCAQWINIEDALSGNSVSEHNKGFIKAARECLESNTFINIRKEEAFERVFSMWSIKNDS